MKLSNRLLSIFLCIIMMLGSVTAGGEGLAEILDAFCVTASATSSGTCGDNLTWTLDDEGVLTISGTGDMKYDLLPWRGSKSLIKSVVIGNGVTSISNSAFGGCRVITSVTIPNSVTNIGNNAFNGCMALTSITIPESVTSIGAHAFEHCESLTSITIPDGVTSIGEDAFYNCTSLTSITIGNSVTSVGNSAFEYCTGLTSITIPDSVTSIGNVAFFGCISLESLDIPKSVTTIGDYAFDECHSLINITGGGQIEHLGTRAFSNTGVYFDSSQWDGNALYIANCLVQYNSESSDVENISIKEGTTTIAECLPWDTASGSYEVREISFPKSLLTLSDDFADVFDITGSYVVPSENKCLRVVDNVLFSYSMDKIIDYASCKSETSYTIPTSVKEISDYAFNNCRNLTNITISNGVTHIGDCAFYGCSSLNNITIPTSVTHLAIMHFMVAIALQI